MNYPMCKMYVYAQNLKFVGTIALFTDPRRGKVIRPTKRHKSTIGQIFHINSDSCEPYWTPLSIIVI